MHASLLLADAAQVADGKLNALGVGWSVVGTPTGPTAVAILIKLSWEEAHHKHRFDLALLNHDGEVVVLKGPDNSEAAIRVTSEFDATPRPGTPAGTAVSVPFAITMGPMPLEPNSRYEWRLSIDGESQPAWTAPFSTL